MGIKFPVIVDDKQKIFCDYRSMQPFSGKPAHSMPSLFGMSFVMMPSLIHIGTRADSLDTITHVKKRHWATSYTDLAKYCAVQRSDASIRNTA
jgi:hypothetical protein